MKSALLSFVSLVSVVVSVNAQANGVQVLPGPGQKAVCAAQQYPNTPSQILTIVNLGNSTQGPFIIQPQDGQKVQMKIKGYDNTSITLAGKRWVDPTMSYVAGATLNYSGTGTAYQGFGGWNPEQQQYQLSGCKIEQQ